jgi:hypothetical protein
MDAQGDFAGEGLANQQLGNAYQIQHEYAKAAECFKKFLQISQDADDKISEGAACSSLAAAYEAMGDRYVCFMCVYFIVLCVGLRALFFFTGYLWRGTSLSTHACIHTYTVKYCGSYHHWQADLHTYIHEYVYTYIHTVQIVIH